MPVDNPQAFDLHMLATLMTAYDRCLRLCTPSPSAVESQSSSSRLDSMDRLRGQLCTDHQTALLKVGFAADRSSSRSADGRAE